ncbi:MAG: guanylate kinase [Ruminococcaceae bacterium]|nr:guanylate kinase [Oscillospiraceae bacterium]
MSQGMILVISGPSGVGKTEAALALLKKSEQYVKAVTATTRQKRETEVHGVDYYFFTKEEFKELQETGGLLEYTCYNGNFYGTPKFSVEKSYSEGKVVILVIEIEGALNIKKMYPQATMCFLNAESIEVIENRLRNRKSDSEEAIKGRLEVAKKELEAICHFDFTVINREGKLADAVDEINGIVQKRLGK